VAWQALAAVLGGAQSLHTNSFDEALALPTEESAQLALRTQQILAHETGVADTVDPVAGSWAIEALTDELEKRIVATLARLRKDGGMLKLIEEEVPQREIQERAYRYQQDIEQGRRKIVGVNTLKLDEAERPAKRLKLAPKMEAEQVAKLKAFRRKRDGKAAASAAVRLAKAARSPKENLFPHILHAVESRATLGEIFGTLRDVFGEHNAR
jgi:methylmalonyl-CoA mutase, N-terminal domain